MGTNYWEGSLFRYVFLDESSSEEYKIEVTPTWAPEDEPIFTVRVVTEQEVQIEGTLGEDSQSNKMLHDQENHQQTEEDDSQEEE